MTDEKDQTKAGTIELSEEDLDHAQGGFTAPGDVAGLKQGKKAAKLVGKGVVWTTTAEST